MKWIKRKLTMFLIDLLTGYFVCGAHCGCCGVWIPNSIVPYYWRIDVCDKCKEDN